MLEMIVTFRVTGSEVDPNEISVLLGLKPSSGHRRGDPHFGNEGRRYADFSEGLWALETTLEKTRPLKEHLDELGFLLADKEAILRGLRARAYDLEIFVGVFDIKNGDEVGLSAAQMRMWADLGVDIGFDLYTWNEPEVAAVEASH